MPNLDQSESLMKRRSDTVKETFTIPSEIKYIREASSAILKSLEPYKIDRSALFDIRLCVEEIVRNAITHGNRSDEKKPVKIDYRLDGDKFIIEVEDRGTGFDYKKIPDPTHKDNIMEKTGRGVYLVRHLMDKVEYNDKGNKVKLTKYI